MPIERIFTLRVPNRNLLVTDRLVVFGHPWRKADMVWIVPHRYIRGLSSCGYMRTKVQISQDYFTVPAGPIGWRDNWSRHSA